MHLIKMKKGKTYCRSPRNKVLKFLKWEAKIELLYCLYVCVVRMRKKGFGHVVDALPLGRVSHALQVNANTN